MTRRLLPYEHDLIATLGVTEEEYIDFLSIQETYSDPKEGTIVDVRHVNADFNSPDGCWRSFSSGGSATCRKAVRA